MIDLAEDFSGAAETQRELDYEENLKAAEHLRPMGLEPKAYLLEFINPDNLPITEVFLDAKVAIGYRNACIEAGCTEIVLNPLFAVGMPLRVSPLRTFYKRRRDDKNLDDMCRNIENRLGKDYYGPFLDGDGVSYTLTNGRVTSVDGY